MKTLRSARLSSLLLWLLLHGGSAGCQTDDATSGGSVCPSCDPQYGGDTGDFGGVTVGVCGAVARRVVIDAAQAVELGFDMPEIARRIARPIDASLRWVARDDEGGGAATGFDVETRVRADIAITEYGYNRPAPEFCDGTVCTLDGSSVLQATCVDHFLDLAVRVTFASLDGAVRGTARGQAVQWRAGSRSAEYNPALPVQVNADANLFDVTGSLRLAPEPGHEHYRGQLSFSAELSSDRYAGSLFPSVHYDTPARSVWYAPLTGYFPANSPAAGGSGRPEVDDLSSQTRAHDDE